MPDDGSHFKSPKLTKERDPRRFVVGDEYTFILDEVAVKEDGNRALPGDDISRWFDTSVPAGVFKIIKHQIISAKFVYECQFIGYLIARDTPEGKTWTVEPTIPKD